MSVATLRVMQLDHAGIEPLASQPLASSGPSPPGRPPNRALYARVTAEFLEMPCLRLTLAQAARLFHLDREACVRVLGALVADGVLVSRDGVFALAPRS